MRTLACLVALACVASLASGCRRSRSTPARTKVPAPAGGAAVAEAEDDGDAAGLGDGGGGRDVGDGGSAIVEDARRYDVRTWSFPLARYAMRIEDVGMKASLDEVLERTGAELAVNGGFFDPNGKPVGLALSDGALLSRLSSGMSGGVVTSDGERAKLHATEGFTLPEGTRFAIQCKPRLVVDGRQNIKSDDGRRSERTALCLRDGGQTVDVIVVTGGSDSSAEGGPSLFAMGKHLARRGCEGALNLDGGPSTAVAWRHERTDGGKGDGEKTVSRLGPRGPLRHAIVFVPR